VQEVKVGQVKEAKQPERDGDADEKDTKSKTWFVLQHQQETQSGSTRKETWTAWLPYQRVF
jgi:hypothetical protein